MRSRKGSSGLKGKKPGGMWSSRAEEAVVFRSTEEWVVVCMGKDQEDVDLKDKTENAVVFRGRKKGGNRRASRGLKDYRIMGIVLKGK